MEETNLFCYLLPPFLYLILNHINSPRNLPPGPYPWPVIGNLLNLGNKPHISLANLSKTHGPLMSLTLGTQLLVVGSSPSAAAEILIKHDHIFSARSILRAAPASPDRLHLSMAWADCNDQWRYLRALCRTELLSSKMIESQARIRENKMAELVAFLSTKEGCQVKIVDVVFVTVFNMLSRIFFSREFMSLEEDSSSLRASTRKLMHVLSAPNLADYYTILRDLDLQGQNKRAKEIYAECSCIWQDIIQERRENKDTSTDVSRERDFLDGLINSGLGDDQVNYLLLELFFAGADTANTSVEWALAELIKNPEAMRKVCLELKEVIGVKIVKESDLPFLPYLDSVVKETLRLHPSSPLLLPHRAAETCQVMNYTIPKDTRVFVNAWAIGRDPNFWEDPVSFKPERFLDDTRADFVAKNQAYIPFGAGTRICPGLLMATKQVALILGGLIQSFDWCLPPAEVVNPTDLDMEEKYGITLHKEKPLLLIPKVRKING